MSAEVHQAWQADTLGRVRVACPASVLAYDPVLMRVLVQLASPLMREDPLLGVLIPVPIPPFFAPVAFPSGAACSISWPLAPGDSGLVVFADRSTDGWRASGVPGLPPTDARRFGIEDGHFIPMSTGKGPVPDPGLVAGAALPAMVLTAPAVQLGGATAVVPLALATLVQAELAKLWAAIGLVNLAGGAPDETVAAAVTAGAAPVAATKVRGI